VDHKKLNIHIPTLNANYWILMILATTLGEIFGNLISRNLGLGYEVGSILLVGLYVLVISFIAIYRKESPFVYWLLIILGNIAGTDCADFITIEPLKLGTIWGSLFVATVLVAIMVVWKIISPRFSIKEGLNGKTFFLYWFAILTSSTFGTTFGDLLSNDTQLGSSGGTLLLAVVLGATFWLYKYTNISNAILYWFALVAVHPIGATIGNYISKPEGFNFGNIWTSVVLGFAFVFIFIKQYNGIQVIRSKRG